jgi:hypothetical protein
MDDLPQIPVHTPATPTPMREPENSDLSQILKCFICSRTLTWDEKYRFWFFHESYSFPECE